MKVNKLILSGILIALTAVCANAVVVDAAVATVNGKPILQSDFDKVAGAFEAQYTAAAPKLMEQPGVKLKLEKEVLDQMINDELLFQAAEKEGVKAREDEIDEAVKQAKDALIPAADEKGKPISEKERTKQFDAALKKEGISQKQFRDKLKKQIMSRKYVETAIVTKVKPVEEADAKALYDQVKAVMKKDSKKTALIKPEEHKKEVEAIAMRLEQLSAPKVRIGHIFLEAPKAAGADKIKEKEALAKEIKKKIDGGMDFSTAVRQFSDDKNSQSTGGDMILIKGAPNTPKEIDTKAFSLDVGKVSDPIKTDFGFHIIKIKEKSAAEEITYEKVAREFGQYIAAQRIQVAINEHIKDLNSKAEIKINKDFSALEKPAANVKEEPAKTEPKKK
ncbi:PpiC-type peptidyl-prolyl cis-trans isomerase [Elusimicrobium minutum Pei191]|uniref:peptidylprolyl isomerase n=1 Tax=Elusimicrobium minutum (strain Pei191) TaxID=445932 RepID=B2KET3_ELUMP|nr:peptidylprolyl isomerase [Elusimicrobium minutum]ACC99029.1 PpiC-type peptidyl-prolyl cis-trans isomerase [Elusimicrobium minutum Pei191]